MPAVPSNGIATGQVTVLTAALLICQARGDRKRITIVNGATAVVIGTSAVTTVTGVALAAGAQLVLETTAAVYGIGAASSPVSYIEEFA